MFDSAVDLTVFVGCFIGLFFCIKFLRLLNNLSDSTDNLVYRNAEDEAVQSKGIYVEHGMKISKDGYTAIPQKKRSASYYDLLR